MQDMFYITLISIHFLILKKEYFITEGVEGGLSCS